MTKLRKGLNQRVCDELAATNAQAALLEDAISERCVQKNPRPDDLLFGGRKY